MRAIVWTKYGDPDGLVLKEIEQPSPKDNEILIQVHASSVTAGDCEMRSLTLPIKAFRLPIRLYFGYRQPKDDRILGQEFAGEVVAVGEDVQKFEVGDQLFGHTGFDFGGYGEYLCLPEKGIMGLKPDIMTYAEAATVPIGSMVAYHFLNYAALQPGQKLLINGAGGSIGTISVQYAKTKGAVVTAVDSGEKLAMLSSLGADYVIDYTREDFTENGEKYDVIFDIVGKSSYSRSLQSLYPGGFYLLGNPKVSHIIRGKWTTRKERVNVFATQPTEEEEIAALQKIKKMIEAGMIKSIIDKTYPLEKLADAHLYVESGRKQGNVAIIHDPTAEN